MPLNFNKPLSSDNFVTGVLPELLNGRKALAQLLDPAYAGTLTGTPAGAKRLTGTSDAYFEEFTGVSWAEKSMAYVKKDGGVFTSTVQAPSIEVDGKIDYVGSVGEGIRLLPTNVGANPTISLHCDRGTGIERRAYLQYVNGATTTSGLRLVNDDVNDQFILNNSGDVNALRFYRSASATAEIVWHSGNLTPANYAPLNGAAFTGNITGEGSARFGGSVYGTLGARGPGTYGGAGPHAAADELVIDSNAGSAGLSILTPNSSYGGIFFGDPESNLSGQFRYTHSTDTLSIHVGGLNTARVSSTGLDVTGGVSTSTETCTMAGLLVGYRGTPSLASTATGTLSARGKVYKQTASHTVPASVFTADDMYAIYNNSASAISILQGAGLTLRQAGTANTGTRTLAPRGWATVWFVSASEAVLSGPGVS